jgi:hypothetical protein
MFELFGEKSFNGGKARVHRCVIQVQEAVSMLRRTQNEVGAAQQVFVY